MKHTFLRTGRRLLALVLCMALLATVAMAHVWDLSAGEILVEASDAGQTVSQNKAEGVVSKSDANPTIKGNFSATEQGASGITVKTEGNATAQITLDNAMIASRDGQSGIEVGDAKVNITVNNTADNKNPYSPEEFANGISSINGESGIHVTTGSVTINGGAEGSAKPSGPNTEDSVPQLDLIVSGEDGAAIGSLEGETMSGDITISGDVAIYGNTWGGDAAVGSGAGGGSKKSLSGGDTGSEMSGNITVTDNAEAFLMHGSGAGLGSGRDSVMSGTVTVSGNGGVYEMRKYHSGATIGAGIQEPEYEYFSSVLPEESDYFQDDGGFTGQVLLGQGSDVDFVEYPYGNRKAEMPEPEEPIVTIGNGTEASFDALRYMPISGKQEASSEVLADGTRGSITIERGATIQGTNIQTHQDADPYLNCFVQTGKNDPVTMNHVNVYIVDGAKPSAPAEEIQKKSSFYWVTENGVSTQYEAVRDGNTLVITTEAENAELHCSVYGLQILLNQQGIQTVVFKTASMESSFDVAAAAADRSGSAYLVLAHKDGASSLTIGGESAEALLK